MATPARDPAAELWLQSLKGDVFHPSDAFRNAATWLCDKRAGADGALALGGFAANTRNSVSRRGADAPLVVGAWANADHACAVGNGTVSWACLTQAIKSPGLFEFFGTVRNAKLEADMVARTISARYKMLPMDVTTMECQAVENPFAMDGVHGPDGQAVSGKLAAVVLAVLSGAGVVPPSPWIYFDPDSKTSEWIHPPRFDEDGSGTVSLETALQDPDLVRKVEIEDLVRIAEKLGAAHVVVLPDDNGAHFWGSVRISKGDVAQGGGAVLGISELLGSGWAAQIYVGVCASAPVARTLMLWSLWTYLGGRSEVAPFGDGAPMELKGKLGAAAAQAGAAIQTDGALQKALEQAWNGGAADAQAADAQAAEVAALRSVVAALEAELAASRAALAAAPSAPSAPAQVAPADSARVRDLERELQTLREAFRVLQNQQASGEADGDQQEDYDKNEADFYLAVQAYVAARRKGNSAECDTDSEAKKQCAVDLENAKDNFMMASFKLAKEEERNDAEKFAQKLILLAYGQPEDGDIEAFGFTKSEMGPPGSRPKWVTGLLESLNTLWLDTLGQSNAQRKMAYEREKTQKAERLAEEAKKKEKFREQQRVLEEQNRIGKAAYDTWLPVFRAIRRLRENDNNYASDDPQFGSAINAQFKRVYDVSGTTPLNLITMDYDEVKGLPPRAWGMMQLKNLTVYEVWALVYRFNNDLKVLTNKNYVHSLWYDLIALQTKMRNGDADQGIPKDPDYNKVWTEEDLEQAPYLWTKAVKEAATAVPETAKTPEAPKDAESAPSIAEVQTRLQGVVEKPDQQGANPDAPAPKRMSIMDKIRAYELTVLNTPESAIRALPSSQSAGAAPPEQANGAMAAMPEKPAESALPPVQAAEARERAKGAMAAMLEKRAGGAPPSQQAKGAMAATPENPAGSAPPEPNPDSKMSTDEMIRRGLQGRRQIIAESDDESSDDEDSDDSSPRSAAKRGDDRASRLPEAQARLARLATGPPASDSRAGLLDAIRQKGAKPEPSEPKPAPPPAGGLRASLLDAIRRQKGAEPEPSEPKPAPPPAGGLRASLLDDIRKKGPKPEPSEPKPEPKPKPGPPASGGGLAFLADIKAGVKPKPRGETTAAPDDARLDELLARRMAAEFATGVALCGDADDPDCAQAEARRAAAMQTFAQQVYERLRGEALRDDQPTAKSLLDAIELSVSASG